MSDHTTQTKQMSVIAAMNTQYAVNIPETMRAGSSMSQNRKGAL